MCIQPTSCHDFHETLSDLGLIMEELVGRSVASPSSARLINCTLKVSCWEPGRRQLNGPSFLPPWLACMAMARMAHMAAGTAGVLESEEGEGGSVCV